MKKLAPIVCTLAAALMFYLSQGTHNVWWQAWLAPLPILWLAYGPARGAIVAVSAFFAFALGQLYLVEVYFGQMPVSFLVTWLVLFGALFMLAVLAARLVWHRLPPYAALFAFPVFWTAFEYLVSLVSPHGTFGAIAYSQVSFPPALQIASLFGLYAISFLLSLFANAIAMLARGHKGPAALGIALAAASLVFGVIRLAEPQAAPIRVAALSDWRAAHPSSLKGDPVAVRQFVADFLGEVRDAAAKGARVVVTPETGILIAPERQGMAAPLSRIAGAYKATLVIGSLGIRPSRNVAMSYSPDGVIHQYDKRHLLYPFEARFTPGTSPGLLGQGRAVAICKDMDFPATLRADALSAEAAGPDGIRIMAVPANDFVKDGWLHARMAVLRGVENGFSIVRSAFNGLETISDAQGRILARADTNHPGLTEIITDVPPGPGPTLYTSIGDIFSWLMLLVSAALLALAFRRSS
jgi:apolipoprotein N-acyltransferase